eukprot:CAMPEP_0197048520 /NCGR_PEP_ID=MMETSP1384-20130603/23856_1 /TAXON_ID=29189 /ORGANISM="Ammonia sp." /LENGTH=382 /DNA_ID=CAMNT_0042480665 /DNA_START=33 /DNA_END=1181 /DNA_ORIENTATION=-
MSSTAKRHQVLLISGYARHITSSSQPQPPAISLHIIETCIMFYNGLCFHVEIAKGPQFSELNEEALERICHPLSWSNIDATTFDVRRGPNYTDGQKQASKAALYTIFKFEGFQLDKSKMHQIWHYVHPTLGTNGDEFQRIMERYAVPDDLHSDYADYALPPLLIINVMIPNYNPEMSQSSRSLSKKGKVKNDGPGYSGIIYAHLSEHVHHKMARYGTQSKSSKPVAISPAVKLLSHFIRSDEQKVDRVRERFKCMARVMNGKHAKFGFVANKLIKKYNAKPFLAKTSTKFYYEKNRYFAVDIDIHSWSYAAKKGLYLVKDNANKTIYDVAFTIEGRQNHELPEQVLCAGRVSKLGLTDMCVPLPDGAMKRYLTDRANENHKK